MGWGGGGGGGDREHNSCPSNNSWFPWQCNPNQWCSHQQPVHYTLHNEKQDCLLLSHAAFFLSFFIRNNTDAWKWCGESIAYNGACALGTAWLESEYFKPSPQVPCLYINVRCKWQSRTEVRICTWQGVKIHRLTANNQYFAIKCTRTINSSFSVLSTRSLYRHVSGSV